MVCKRIALVAVFLRIGDGDGAFECSLCPTDDDNNIVCILRSLSPTLLLDNDSHSSADQLVSFKSTAFPSRRCMESSIGARNVVRER
jgi:hypothetical protein